MRPPRFARALLRRLSDPSHWEEIDGDLTEWFARTAATGRLRARLSYWRIVVVTVAGLCVDRGRRLARGVWGGAGELKMVMRVLRRQPVTTATLITTLALGIGANALGYSVLHALLLAPLPVTDEATLMVIREVRTSEPNSSGGVSYLNVKDWQTQTTAFSSLALVNPDQAAIRTADAVVQADGLTVSASFFSVLGVRPAMGTTFDAFGDFGQTSSGAWPIMLTHRGWHRLFGGDGAIVGRTIVVDGQQAQIVGITPRDLFPVAEEPIDYWITPAASGSASDSSSTNGSRNFRGYAAAIGRLQPDVSVERARQDLERINATLAQSAPRVFAGRRVDVQPLRSMLTQGSAAGAWTLAALVGFVWLLTCSNAINLQLARATARARDVDVRRALGGTRAELMRPFLIENILIALAAGVTGFVLARFAAAALLPWLPGDVPSLPGLIPGGASLIATLLLSLGTGVLCGAGPAWFVTRGNTRFVTADRSRTTVVPALVRNSLLATQVALALALLAGGGLLAGSLYRQMTASPGFAGSDVWTTRVSLTSPRYKTSEALTNTLSQIRESLLTVRGVDDVAFSQSVPFTGLDNSTRVAITGPVTSDSPSTQLRFASPDYLRVMRIPLVEGRAIERTDTASTTPVAVVNLTFATQHFGSARQAFGRTISLGWGGDAPKHIVGVAGDVRHGAPSDSPAPEVYVPHAQFPNQTMSVVMRMRPGHVPESAAVHAAIARIEPDVARQSVRAMEAYRAERLAAPRFAAALLAGFAVLALTLAAVGVYGTVSYLTTARTREIGVRLALGASRGSVFGLVVRQVFTPVAVGIIAGIGLAFAGGRVLGPWLYDVTPTDLPTFAAVCSVLAVAAFAAAVPPARRATHVNPAETLRSAE